MLSPYFWYGQAILNENYMFRTWFVTGLYSGLSLENSFQWISNIGFGQPRVGNPLFGSFYLPAYLGAYINQPTASYIVWLSSMTLGFVGAFKLFSSFTDRRELAFIAGTAFVLSGVLFNNSVITLYAERMMFVPWTLFFFWKGIRDDKIGLIVSGSVLHALHFLASTSFTWFYLSSGMGLFLAGYFVYLVRLPENTQQAMSVFIKVTKIGILFFGLCALLITVQILPILEYDPLAVHREQTLSQYVSTGRFSPRTLFQAPFWFPGAFGDSNQLFFYSNLSYLGWVPIFLSTFWIINTPRKQVLFVGILLICILLAAAKLSPLKEIVSALPGMATVRFSSFWMLAWNFVILILAVKAGGALGESITLDKARRMALLLLFLTVITALALFVFKGAELSIELMRPLIVGFCVCGLFIIAQRWKLKSKTILPALALISVLDSSSWAVRSVLNDAGPSNGFITRLNDLRAPQPSDVLRVGGQGQGRAIAICSNEAQGSPAKLLVSGSNLEWAFTFTSYSLKRSYEIARRLGYSQSTACGRQGISMPAETFFSPNRLALARALNVRYYFLGGKSDKEFVERLGFQFVVHDAYSGFDMYEDVSASPRITWHQNISVVSDLDSALSTLDVRNPLLSDAIVEFGTESRPAWLAKMSGRGSVNVDYDIKYQPTKVVLSGHSDRPSLLVLSDIFYPGWEATVDGEKIEMYPANIVGRGFFVSAGEHVITFEYRPWFLWFGMFLSGLSWLGVIIYGLNCLKTSRSQLK